MAYYKRDMLGGWHRTRAPLPIRIIRFIIIIFLCFFIESRTIGIILFTLFYGIPLLIIVIPLLFSKFTSISTASRKRELEKMIYRIEQDNRLNLTEHIFYPEKQVALCADKVSRKLIVSNEKNEPAVFDFEMLTRYTIRKHISRKNARQIIMENTSSITQEEHDLLVDLEIGHDDETYTFVTIHTTGKIIVLPFSYYDNLAQQAQHLLAEIVHYP